MIEINEQTVIDGLSEIVSEFGEDYKYPRTEYCVYVHEGQPDCIVGKFLARQGVPVERLAKADAEANSLGGSLTARVLLVRLETEGVIHITPIAQKLLSRAQGEQDAGRRWGAVLNNVEQRFADLTN